MLPFFLVFVMYYTLSGLQLNAQPNELANPGHEPPMLGVVWHKGLLSAPNFARPNSKNTALLYYRGGRILPTVVSKSIFWGPSWSNPSFVGDKISGLDAFYIGHNGSSYAATVNEYYDTINGGHYVGSSGLVHQGHIIDTSTAAGGNQTSAILAEVCKQISAGNIIPDPNNNGYYPVYSDVRRGNAGYCAWHSYGTCTGSNTQIQFVFFFNTDGDPGCDPQDTLTGHSQGLASLANLSAHEISEARSDPAYPGAWYDSSGAENSDKCAWSFNHYYLEFPDQNIWKLQGNWSNNAFLNKTGYPNRNGQLGCIDGGP